MAESNSTAKSAPGLLEYTVILVLVSVFVLSSCALINAYANSLVVARCMLGTPMPTAVTK